MEKTRAARGLRKGSTVAAALAALGGWSGRRRPRRRHGCVVKLLDGSGLCDGRVVSLGKHGLDDWGRVRARRRELGLHAGGIRRDSVVVRLDLGTQLLGF